MTSTDTVTCTFQGVSVTASNSLVQTMTVPTGSRLIACKAFFRPASGARAPGLIAAVSDGSMVTGDRSWKCTADYSDGWTSTGFDDFSWLRAANVIQSGQQPMEMFNGDIANAGWIWTQYNSVNSPANPPDSPVYCRCVLRKYLSFSSRLPALLPFLDDS